MLFLFDLPNVGETGTPVFLAEGAKSGKSLCQFDALFLISWDQSWAAEAIVSQAASTTATLAGVRIIQTPQRAKALFRDDTYAVIWGGAGYHVDRNADSVPALPSFSPPESRIPPSRGG